MELQDIKSLKSKFEKNKVKVSQIEYTSNNFDDDGNLIKTDLPTITTNYCEIGLHNNKVYFVFIINSESFKKDLFDSIKQVNDLKIYGFKDFKTTLYPSKYFDYKIFRKNILKDKYLQIQFTFRDIKVPELYKEYLKIIDKLEKNNIKIVNQLKVKLNQF